MSNRAKIIFIANLFFATSLFPQEVDSLFYVSLSWSADGASLVYSALKVKDMRTALAQHTKPRIDIYRVNADGKGNQLLLEGGMFPSISPDGKSIAYNSMETNRSIYLLNLSTGEKFKITGDDTASFIAPRFSPDGKKLCYSFGAKKVLNLGIIDIESRNKISITTDTLKFCNPVWSDPERNSLFFYEQSSDGKDQIYSINILSHELTNLTKDTTLNFYPLFNTKRKKIIYTNVKDGKKSIIEMNPDGSGKVPVFTEFVNPFYTDISPDGSLVAIITSTDLKSNISIKNIKTGKVIVLQ